MVSARRFTCRCGWTGEDVLRLGRGRAHYCPRCLDAVKPVRTQKVRVEMWDTSGVRRLRCFGRTPTGRQCRERATVVDQKNRANWCARHRPLAPEAKGEER